MLGTTGSGNYVDHIDEAFVKKYKNRTPPFGPVGFCTFKRTYARRVDGENRTEEFWETIHRCCNGILAVGGKFTKEEIETLYDKVFNLKCLFSGRALWQLGTETVRKLGGDSLINCWCSDIDHPIDPFCFAFNELMLGGGVGFNIQAEHVYGLPKVKYDVQIIRRDEKDVDFIVPDNREGWVELLRRVLNAFFYTGKGFSYSTICVRGKGSVIQGFGGVASGPEDLCRGIGQITGVLKGRVGGKLHPVDCLDIMDIIGSVVVAGNIRRSALLALGDAKDSEYLDAKNWSKGKIPNWRDKSNNSVACNKYEELPAEFWGGYNGDGEPYGLVNLKNCRVYGRLADGKDYRPDKHVVGTNPCVVGETLVYVADGRGHVPMATLAVEGKDVPVFCRDEKDNVVVRTMRHPRLTGTNVPVVKITLEDGHVLRTTPNHKFFTSEGQYVEASNLRVGDGLRTLSKSEASIKDVFPQANSHSQDYLWIRFSGKSIAAEHKIVAEFNLGRKICSGEVVHHKDYNGKNNAISNLVVMSRSDHTYLHSRNMIGDKNPMRRAQTEWSEEKWEQYSRNMSQSVSGDKNGRFCGEDNDALKKHALDLCRSIGRRFSTKEWQAYAQVNGLPQGFSKWRKDHLGGIRGLALWAVNELGLNKDVSQNMDPRTLRLYEKSLEEGYDTFVSNETVMVRKECECCSKPFEVSYQHREQGTCSSLCGNKLSWQNDEYRHNCLEGRRKIIEQSKAEVRNQQLAAYNAVKTSLGHEPMKKEWVDACKSRGISFEISRTTSPFRYWEDLKVAATSFNHRITSIEGDGTANVYNGTVDEFHNLFIGGFEEKTSNGKRKYLYYSTKQCGEVPLENAESCNLCEIFLPNIKDEEEFKVVAGLLYKVAKTVSCMRYQDEKTNEVVSRNHRLGISVTGFLQAPHLRDEKIFDSVYKHMEKLDKEYSRLLSVKNSIKLTTCKPSGTASLLPGVTPGVHPAYSPYYIRRIRMSSSDPLVDTCRKHGYHIEPLKRLDGTNDLDTMVVAFPIKTPDGTICAKDVTAVQQLEYAKWLQTNWSDNSVSVTVYYKIEELPAIKEWLKANYDKSVKTVSFCLHSGHGFQQAPYEEITEAQYQEMSKACKPITRLDNDSGGVLSESLECAGGSCPVK